MFKLNKTTIDWLDVKNKCRTTINLGESDKEPSSKWKLQLLIAEHSPIRLLRINWKWDEIKSFVATHFSRHWIGWSKWISTRRSDRIGQNRDVLPQGEIVQMEIEANAQALINVSRFRLCFQADPDTREKMEEVKHELKNVEPEISSVMMPNCFYRCGCPEFKACGLWDKLIKDIPKEDLIDIQRRYKIYNDWFYNKK